MDKTRITHFDPADGELIARFTTFMVKTVRFAKLEYIRHQKHWNKEVPVFSVPDSPYLGGNAQPHEYGIGDGEFFFAHERIADAFLDLAELPRRILELSFVAELSAMEIAELLGCSVKAVYNQKHAALKKLRDALLKGGERNGEKLP